MYYCGYGDRALHLLAQHAGGALFDDGWMAVNGPSFSLPGDDPVYAPDRPADIRHVDIDVRLNFEDQSVAGTVTTHYTALFEQVTNVTLDAAELVIEQVTMGGGKAALAHWTEAEKLHIQLDRAYRHGEQFAVTIRYAARPRTGLVFVKPEPGDPNLPVQAWTQGQTEYHHFWFPCHDFPNDRATTALRATVPGNFFALSNGKLEETLENGDGSKTYAWRQDVPHPAYLITLVAGEFAELSDRWRDVPVNYYVQPGREDDAHRMLDNTPEMMELYSKRFGENYPYAKYAQVVADKFLGAMENTSATTHSYRLLPDARASLDWTPEPVVAHELVHQWFGDLLTCRDWGHIWLNESFATYFEAVWTEHHKGQDEFRTELLGNLEAYQEADGRGRRPIVYNVYRKNGSELFDRHVYEKGSLVLHMLRFVVGEEPFWRAIQTYVRQNKGREVITADLERAFEEATGRSLARFFEQWVYGAGHPDFKVCYSWDNEQRMAKVTIRQTQQVDDKTALFATPVEIGFMVPNTEAARADDRKVSATLQTFRVTIDQESQTLYFPLPRRPFSVRFDQGGWLIKTLDFERPSELLRYQLRHDPDVLGRIEAAQALGKLADVESVAALEQALLAEPFWSVQAEIASALGKQRTERALNTLVAALDKVTEPKARRAIVAALGAFRAPEQAALAERAAKTLTGLLEHGEPSYFVEGAAAAALGKTRAPGAFGALEPMLERSSWNETIRGSVFAGLGELGEARVADIAVSWLLDRTKPMDARFTAANGLGALARTKRIDPGATQTKVVDALIAALDDPWELTLYAVVSALAEWGDARAIPALQRVISTTTDERLLRGARVAVARLQRGRSSDEETRKLRTDLDEVREENRELRGRLEVLEARSAPATNGHTPATADARANGETTKSATAKATPRAGK